jgi:hypothetical protein
LRDEAARPLPVEEFLRRLHMPMSEREREEGQELIRWFKRRYPTARERLAYAREAYRRWAPR